MINACILLEFQFSDIAAFPILRGVLLICSGVLPSVSAPIVSSRSKSKKTQFSKDKIFSWNVHTLYINIPTKIHFKFVFQTGSVFKLQGPIFSIGVGLDEAS